MNKILPFKGWIPDIKCAEFIVSRPFESYSKEELHQVLNENAVSFLHVIKPHETENELIDYEDKLHLGKKRFDAFCQSHVFNQDTKPCYYLYRQTRNGNTYTGIIAAISIDDFINGNIKPHEHTIEHKEEKLKHYLNILQINTEPVIISFPDHDNLDSIIQKVLQSKPDIAFNRVDFGFHELWKISSDDEIEQIQACFSEIDKMYIADGHHRTGSSVLLGIEKRKNNTLHTGKEPYNYFMGLLIPFSHIRLSEFNRLVYDLNGLSTEELITQLSDNFHVEKHTSLPSIQSEPTCFAIYVDKNWYSLSLKETISQQIVEESALPTRILTNYLLSPILGIHDLRKDKRIGFLGGETNPTEIERVVETGKAKAVFVVNKISMEVLKRFADMGWFMPPKTTYFEPKLLNALVIYSLT